MRLWTLSPVLLDAPRLNGLWREGLFALAVLRGETKGYRHHPQLERFRAAGGAGALLAYLLPVYAEAKRRGYKYDYQKLCPKNEAETAMLAEFIGGDANAKSIVVNSGQVRFEVKHLSTKIGQTVHAEHIRMAANPIFFVRPSDDKEPWEKTGGES